MSISIKNKARIIASLTVGGMIALILIAMGCEGKYGVIEDERVSFDSVSSTTMKTEVTVKEEPAALVVEATPIIETEQDTIVTYKEAEAAFKSRDYNKAVTLFTAYTRQKSKNAWGYYMLGLSAKRTGDLNLAIESFETATTLSPDHFKSWTNLARVYLEKGQPDKALTALDRAIAIEPGKQDGYRLKGRALHQQGSLTEAETAYKLALGIDGDDYWSMNNLALIYIQQHEYDKALPLLALAIEIKENEPIFHNNLGMVLENKGHFRAAGDAYATAVRLDATYTRAADNHDRVSGVAESRGLSVLDLKQLADNQAKEMNTWKGAEIDS